MTNSVLGRLVGLSKKLASGPMPRPSELKFDIADPPRPIGRDTSYFGLTVNQLNLADGRNWWAEYDPLVYVSLDFLYGRERVSIPKIIGPSALRVGWEGGQKQVPHGTLVSDIRVAGPNPYRGEQIGITVILFKVKTNDFAKRVLSVAQGLSDAIGIAGIATTMRIGASVVDGIEAIFDMQGTEPVLGHRIELPALPLDGLMERSVALVANSDKPVGAMKLVDGRLHGPGDAGQYLTNDFVLYSLWSSPTRQVDRTLSFYPQVERMYEAASAGDDTSWERAKAALVTVYQQLLVSADLTGSEAEQLFESYKTQIIKIREERTKVSKLGTRGLMAGPESLYRSERQREMLNKRMVEIKGMSL